MITPHEARLVVSGSVATLSTYKVYDELTTLSDYRWLGRLILWGVAGVLGLGALIGLAF